MANSVLWKHLTNAQVRALGDSTEAPRTKELLNEFLNCSDGRSPSQTEVEVEFHFYNLAFTRDCSFSIEKISTLMSIFTDVLAADRADGHRTMAASFQAFKEAIHAHAVERPPASTAIFTVKDVRKIVDYFTNSYYRHFRLYKYVLAKKPQLSLRQASSGGVEVPPAWPPLADALVEKIEFDLPDDDLVEEEDDA